MNKQIIWRQPGGSDYMNQYKGRIRHEWVHEHMGDYDIIPEPDIMPSRSKESIINDIETTIAENQWDGSVRPGTGQEVLDGIDTGYGELIDNNERILELRDEYLASVNDMGKKRKPARKPNYQSLGEIAEQQGIDAVPNETRMAGDAFLQELQEEATEEKRQLSHLAEQFARYAEIDTKFERAGVPHKAVQDIQEIRQLSNGVPAPYVDTLTKPGIERRVHTGVAENPYTGEREIIAFNNPETNEALVTEFGDGRDGRIDGIEIPDNPRKVGDRASELLGKHIMWLKGDPGARLVVDDKNYARADMDSGDGRGIDTHTLRTGVHDDVVEIQVNTGINPTIRPRGSSNQAVQQMINAQLDDGYNIFEAIDNLKEDPRGGVDPLRIKFGRDAGKDISAGKLVKEGYDGLISPVFNQREALLNVNKPGRGKGRLPQNMQDKSVLRPERIFEIDLHQVRDAINQLSPAEQKSIMKVLPNRGNGGDGVERSRVNVNVPNDMQGVVDISNKGYVAQLLRNLQ